METCKDEFKQKIALCSREPLLTFYNEEMCTQLQTPTTGTESLWNVPKCAKFCFILLEIFQFHVIIPLANRFNSQHYRTLSHK